MPELQASQWCRELALVVGVGTSCWSMHEGKGPVLLLLNSQLEACLMLLEEVSALLLQQLLKTPWGQSRLTTARGLHACPWISHINDLV